MSNLPFRHSYRALTLDPKHTIDVELLEILANQHLSPIPDTLSFKSIFGGSLGNHHQLEELAYGSDFWRIDNMAHACFKQNSVSKKDRTRNGPEILFLVLSDLDTRNEVKFAFIEDYFLNSTKNAKLNARVAAEKLSCRSIDNVKLSTTEFSIADFPILALYLLQKKIGWKDHEF